MSGVAVYSTFDIRLRAVESVERGIPKGQVAIAFGIDRSTLYRWCHHCQQEGTDGLYRQEGSGRPKLLNELNEKELQSIVLSSALSYGFESDLWTVGRLHRVITEKFCIQVSKHTIWRRLVAAGLTYQKPERGYYEANEEVRKHWRRYVIPKIKHCILENKSIFYFQDESNVSLAAFLGKTWSPFGQTPKATITGLRGGISAMFALSNRGFLVFRLYEKRIASVEVIEFLCQMLLHHPRRHLVVVMDQATPHTSKLTRQFIESQKRLHVFYLPSYSPNWNPDEKVWNHLKCQELKSHQEKTKAELKELTQSKLQAMSKNPKLFEEELDRQGLEAKSGRGAEFGVQYVSFCEFEVSESGEMRGRCALMLPFWALAERKVLVFWEKVPVFAKNRQARLERANRMTENEIVRGSLL